MRGQDRDKRRLYSGSATENYRSLAYGGNHVSVYEFVQSFCGSAESPRDVEEVDMDTRNLKAKACNEAKHFAWIALYLWAFLAVLEIHKSIILAENNINLVAHGFAIINALALAKVMLVARELRLGDLPGTPLIYPTLLKSGLFSLLLVCFKILEATLVGLYHGLSFGQSIAELGGTWRGILSFVLIAFVLLAPFFAISELGELVGESNLVRVFFVRRQISGLPVR